MGYADEELMFFDMPLTGSYRPKYENTRLGMVTVEGGSLSVSQLVSLLRLFVPSDNFEWEVSSSEDNVFKVQFPSKLELQQMIRFGKFNVPTSECRITFDEWSPKLNPNWLVQDVWVRIAGIPPAVKGSFLALWGLGSPLGKTKEVDMAFTCQHGVLRIFIGWVDYTCIPERKDLLIKDGLYRLTFQVEGPPREEGLGDEVMHDANEGDDEGDKKKDASEKSDLDDRGGKRGKNVDGDTSTSSSVGGSGGAAAPTSSSPTDGSNVVMIRIGSVETPVPMSRVPLVSVSAPMSYSKIAAPRRLWADLVEEELPCFGSAPPRVDRSRYEGGRPMGSVVSRSIVAAPSHVDSVAGDMVAPARHSATMKQLCSVVASDVRSGHEQGALLPTSEVEPQEGQRDVE